MKHTINYLKDFTTKLMTRKMWCMILAIIFSIIKSDAQTDSGTTGNFSEQFPNLQPLKVDMTKILPEKQKSHAAFSPVFHTDWQQFFVPSARYQVVESDIHRSMMIPYWGSTMFDDVRVQPLFKIKSGKNSFSFGIGINVDAVRRGIDIQRMEQRQQQMMNMRRW